MIEEMTKFICRRGGDCICRDTAGRCAREPVVVYVDPYGHYGNESCSSARFCIAVNLTQCHFQGRQLEDNERLVVSRGRKKWMPDEPY